MTNILNNLVTIGILTVILIVAYSGATYLWNRKYLPFQLTRGKLKKPLGTIFKEVHQYTFKEDSTTMLKKGNPKAQKLLTYKNLHKALVITGIIGYILSGNINILLALILSFIIGFSRAIPVTRRRTEVLDRIFLIASSSIKFTAGPRAKNAIPPASWNHIQVEKWQGKETPMKMVISFPSGNGPELNSQKTFQKSFEANVTDENIWNFEWDLPHDRVTIEAAPHLPTKLAYPGSQDAAWSVFPVGESSEGPASYDVSVFPHVLVGGPSGTGKLVALGNQLLSANKGWVTIGDLEVGDTIFGVDGKPTKVTHLHPIIIPETAYKVTFRNGETVTVDADHLWETETYNARRSRYANLNEESDKIRQNRFADRIITNVQAEIAAASDTDTISISELATLVETYPERKYLHDLAKRVGPAEQVTPKQVFHYGAQTVQQNQMVTRVDFKEFTNWYNNRAETKPTSKFPLVRGHYEKLDQLAYEVRDTDLLTIESVLEYLDAWQKMSADWIRENINTNLPTLEMVKDLKNKAEGKYNLLPAQILVPAEDQIGMISKQDVASLLGLPLEAVQSVWSVAIRTLKKQTKNRELVELLVSEKTITRNANPYFTYPKKLILSHLIKDNNTALWDQRDKLAAGTTVITTQEIADSLKTEHGFANHYVQKAEAIDLLAVNLPINPYIFGAWLGDGYSRTGKICGIDHEIFTRCMSLGYEYTSESWTKRDERKHADYRVLDFPRLHQELKDNNLLAASSHRIRKDGEVKYIPAPYFVSSIEQRRELLRGLLDTDGSVSNNTGDINFHSSNEVLATDVKRLIASLGYIPYMGSKIPTYDYKGENLKGKRAYTVSFQADPADRLFGLTRKNEAHQKSYRGDRLDYRTHTIVSVERVESVPMRCLSVDSPDRLFLVSDSLIPTHNSVLQRNIVFHTIQHNDRWRFLGVDLKRVELTPFNKYKKTVMGIATDVEKGLAVLQYANNEMMDRYKQMESLGVNNVMDLADPPYCILLMIDEATMFLGTSGSKTEEGKAEDAMKGEAADLVGRILRLGRACGIHMLIAMQRPDATVLRGEFKANMDVRLAAGRMDSTPSSMILDSGEAVNLPGIRGRGIIRVGGSLTVFQGYFAPPEWIDDFIMNNPHVEPSTLAPGGHLHDKYKAMKRLEAKAAAEAAAESSGEGEASTTSSPNPTSSTPTSTPTPTSTHTAPTGLKGLLRGKKNNTSENSSEVVDASSETVSDEIENIDDTAVEDIEISEEFSVDPLPDYDDEIEYEEEPVTENHKSLLDSLNKKEEDELEGVVVNEIPDFFTGSAKKEELAPKPEPEPDLELDEDDFILDDFDEEEEVSSPLGEEMPAPPSDILTKNIAEPEVEHVWVSASPFGGSVEQEKKPEPVNEVKVESVLPSRPVRPTTPVAPIVPPLVEEAKSVTAEKPQRPVAPFASSSLPSRPVSPFASKSLRPASPADKVEEEVTKPQRPVSPFAPKVNGNERPVPPNGNPFRPKSD